MSFLLDLIFAAVIIGMVLVWWNHAVSTSLFSLLSLFLSLTLAFFLSVPISIPVADAVLGPGIRASAANDLADLFSAPHLSSGEETVAQLSFDQMLWEAPAPFVKVLDAYGADLERVREAYDASPEPESLLKAVTDTFIRDLSRSLCFAVLWVALGILIKLITRRIEDNMRPPARLKGVARVLPSLIALASSVAVIWGISLILQWMLPYLAARDILFNETTLDSSFFYHFLNFLNPFARLLSL